MSLFSPAQREQIDLVAKKSVKPLESQKGSSKSSRSVNSELIRISEMVQEYFSDSSAILITTPEQLHDYVSELIEVRYAGIDTETTGLDVVRDTIVGVSLYYPGGVECYIPIKHLVPIFDVPVKNQLTYEQVRVELQRMADEGVRLIFANADFDLAMIYKDIHVDFNDNMYVDVLNTWRCLKEDEKDNSLKGLYNKYVLKGKGDPKKFSDFFSAALFRYCRPEIAKLYAAHDAKITYELFLFELPYITKDHVKCKEHGLQAIADLVWQIEMPMVKVCQNLHRVGIYLDEETCRHLKVRYKKMYEQEQAKLSAMVQEILDTHPTSFVGGRTSKLFTSGRDFNGNSTPHVIHLFRDILKIPRFQQGNVSADKETLSELNLPVANQILRMRGALKLISTYVDKLPNSIAADGRIHARFKSVGADCIVGDTLVPTSCGYRTIKSICSPAEELEGTHVDVQGVYVVNKDQTLEHAASVIKYTDYPTIKITTECGFSLEGTYNHPVMVSKYTAAHQIHSLDVRLPYFWEDRYFKKLEDIQIGDYVEIPCNFNISPKEYVKLNLSLGKPYQTSRCVAKIPEVLDESVAEFLGMYHADGAAGIRAGTYTISFSNDDEDVISRVDKLSRDIFNVETSHYTAKKDENEVETYINCMQIRDFDTLLSHGKQNKQIPEAIYQSPASVVKAYIRGMTLDSSVYIDENGRAAFELSIITDQDAKFVQCFLASQGILCSLGWNENKGGWRSPRLCFNADNYILFRDKIGFVESRKHIETEGCMKNKYSSRRVDNSFRLKVKSVEYSTNTVYDLHIPKTHSFVSNGFISHNTGRMSSYDPNLQNIPSHATDIRHMFRASAESKQEVECQQTDTTVSVTLPNYYIVNTPEGETKVHDLTAGSIVQLNHNKTPHNLTIKSINYIENSPDMLLVFESDGDNR